MTDTKERIVERNGTTYVQNISNIGKSRNLPQTIEQPTHTEPQPESESQSESAWQPDNVEYFTVRKQQNPGRIQGVDK